MNPATDPLAGLRDIHAAPAPGFWPPAPGWWLLALLLAAAALAATLWLRRRLRARRFRRQAMRELDTIAARCTDDAAGALPGAVNVWLRRIALHVHAAEEVASLTGAAWLAFLDETGGGGEFSNGAGRVLASAPYRPHTQPVPRAALLRLARAWAGRNLGRRR